ncbi:MAG: hypothetical protein M0030_32535 [Actinomycetota bacterium]|nr:hypothetical protein [Actinomycetota bacterium]
MSNAGDDTAPRPGTAVVPVRPPPGDLDWADLRAAVGWLRARRVGASAVLMVVVGAAWKIGLIRGLYFRQGDFRDLAMADARPWGLAYLTTPRSGQLVPGLRAADWVLARIALYQWGPVLAVVGFLLLVTGLAAFDALRALFGPRPEILIPLGLYLLSPLTLPAAGAWSAAIRLLPLQAVIFLALAAQVRYLRSSRRRHLVAVAAWIAAGLICGEKAVAIPLLLYAITAGFLTGQRGLAACCLAAARRCWALWACSLLLVAGYLALWLGTGAGPAFRVVSTSAQDARFAGQVLLRTLAPGLLGGPWRWFPITGGSYALALPPGTLAWLAVVIVAAVTVVTIARRPAAWRAWAITAGWVLIADLGSLAVGGRLGFGPALLALDSRHVADAVPVAVVCLSLAVWPAHGCPVPPGRPGPVRRPGLAPPAGWSARRLTAALTGAIAAGSLWSAQAYAAVTSGAPAAGYLARAERAILAAPRGTAVLDTDLPAAVIDPVYGRAALASTVLGGIDPGRLRFVTRPDGTLDGLRVFGPTGELDRAWVYGASVRAGPGQRGCLPERNGRILVSFAGQVPAAASVVRIGYLWYPRRMATIGVLADGVRLSLPVRTGLHAGYLPVPGPPSGLLVIVPGGQRLCVGDAEAGTLGAVPGGAVPGGAIP